MPSNVTTRDIDVSTGYNVLLYGLPSVSYIIFVIIFILSILIKIRNKNAYVITRTVLFCLFFISSLSGLILNYGLYLSINKFNNKNTSTVIKNNVFKYNSIVLTIITSITILYLILSHAFGCL